MKSRVTVLLVWIFLGMAITVSPLAIANEQGQQISCSVHMPAEFFHGHNIGIIVTLDNVPAGMEIVAIYARMEFSTNGQQWSNPSKKMEGYFLEEGRYFFGIRSSESHNIYYVRFSEITIEAVGGKEIIIDPIVVGPSIVK